MAFQVAERGQKLTRSTDPAQPGKVRAVFSVHDQHYLDDGGAWQPVDERFVADGADGFAVKADKSRHQVRGATDGTYRWTPRRDTPGEYVTVAAPQWWRTTGGGSWQPFAATVFSQPNEQTLRWEHADFRFEVRFTWRTTKGLYLLKNANAPARLRWGMALTGLTWSDRALQANSDGATVGALAPFIAWDAAGSIEAPNVSVSEAATATHREITVPTSGAVYPITIDPTFTAGGGTNDAEDAWIDQANPTNNNGTQESLYASIYSSGRILRSVLRFDLSSLAGAPVTSATLDLSAQTTSTYPTDQRAYRILTANTGWTVGGVTWNTRDGTASWAGSAGCDTAGTDYATTEAGTFPGGSLTAGDARVATLTPAVMEAMIAANAGFLLRRDDETGTHTQPVGVSADYATAAWRPLLTIEYTTGQFARPNADTSVGTWTTDTGATTNLYDSIDESTASDADFIRSVTAPSSAAYEASLATLTDPVSSTGHVLAVRARHDNGVGGVVTLTSELRQGANALSTPLSEAQALTSSWTTYSYQLSAAQADAITDYATLRTRFTATQAATADAPIPQAVGAMASGAAAITPLWPAHTDNDIALLFVESCGGEAITLSTPAGFVAVTNSPSSTGTTTNGTRISVFWCRATGTTMTDPVVADSGNHQIAFIETFRGCIATGNPWDVTAATVKAAASTSVSITGVTTTVDNCLVVYAAAADNDANGARFSAEANASLTGLTERFDDGSNLGNGGGIGVWTGSKATAGATGTLTATVTSSINAYLVLALKPAANAARAQISWVELEAPAAPAAPGGAVLAGSSDGTSTAAATALRLTHALAGQSDGTSTAAAVRLTQAQPLNAASAGTSTAAATSLRLASALVGATAGTSTAGATSLRLAAALAGTAAGTSTALASGFATDTELDGAASGTSTAAATRLTMAQPLTGATGGTSTAAAAALTLSQALAGASDGFSAVSVSGLTLTAALAGASAGTSTAAGDLTVGAATSLSGSAAGTSTASASSLTLSHALGGTSAGTSTAASTALVMGHMLAGQSAGTSTAAATGLRLAHALAATSTGTSTASVTALFVGHPLAATSTGTSSASGTLTVGTPTGLQGTSAGSSTAAASSLRLSHALVGTSAGTSTAAALSLSLSNALAGTVAGTSSASGTTLVLSAHPLTGTANGTSTAAATSLTVGHILGGASAGTSAGAATALTVGHALAGLWSGTSAASGNLTVPALVVRGAAVLSVTRPLAILTVARRTSGALTISRTNQAVLTVARENET